MKHKFCLIDLNVIEMYSTMQQVKQNITTQEEEVTIDTMFIWKETIEGEEYWKNLSDIACESWIFYSNTEYEIIIKINF